MIDYSVGDMVITHFGFETLTLIEIDASNPLFGIFVPVTYVGQGRYQNIGGMPKRALLSKYTKY